MPGRIDSDTLFLHHLLHVYAFGEYTHVFTCSIRCAQRWSYDKDASMNYGLLLNNNTVNSGTLSYTFFQISDIFLLEYGCRMGNSSSTD